MTLQAPRLASRKSRVLFVLLAFATAAVIAVFIAAGLLSSKQAVVAATEKLHAARPWLIVGQLLVLTGLWLYWGEFVRLIHRIWPMKAESCAALVRGRKRIFVALGAFEAFIVLRAILA